MRYDDPYIDETDIPDPGVGEAYGHAFKQLWPYFFPLLLVTIVGWMLKAPGLMSEGAGDIGAHLLDEGSGGVAALFGAGLMSIGYLLAIAFTVLIIKPLEYGIKFCFLQAARDDRIRAESMFAAFGNYTSAVLASLFVGFIVFWGFVFFVLPGIYFLCKFAFVPYLITDRKLGVFDALGESWRMTNGHALDVFLIWLLGVPIHILGFMALGIGVIPAGMWVALAYASLYHAVDLENEMDAIYV